MAQSAWRAVLPAAAVLPRLVADEGGPPMITDDTATPDDGKREINPAWTFERTGSSAGHEIPLVDISQGFGERIRLRFEAPWAVVDATNAGARSGPGNPKVGVKWRFHDAGDENLRISTCPQLEFENPGSSSPGAHRRASNDRR